MSESRGKPSMIPGFMVIEDINDIGTPPDDGFVVVSRARYWIGLGVWRNWRRADKVKGEW